MIEALEQKTLDEFIRAYNQRDMVVIYQAFREIFSEQWSDLEIKVFFDNCFDGYGQYVGTQENLTINEFYKRNSRLQGLCGKYHDDPIVDDKLSSIDKLILHCIQFIVVSNYYMALLEQLSNLEEILQRKDNMEKTIRQAVAARIQQLATAIKPMAQPAGANQERLEVKEKEAVLTQKPAKESEQQPREKREKKPVDSDSLQLRLQHAPQRQYRSKKKKSKSSPSHSLKAITFFTALIVTLTVVGAVVFPGPGAAIGAGIGFAFTATCIVGYIAFNFIRQKYRLYSPLYNDSTSSSTYAQATSDLCKESKAPVNTATHKRVSSERDEIDDAEEDKIRPSNPMVEYREPPLKQEDVERRGLSPR